MSHGYVNFGIYDAETGEAKRTGTCLEASMANQAGEGEVAIVIANDVESDTHKLDLSGKKPVLVAIPEMEVAAKREAQQRPVWVDPMDEIRARLDAIEVRLGITSESKISS